MSHIQSVMFKREMWSPDMARDWLNQKGLKSRKIHTTANYHRFRQIKPDKQHYYRNKRIGDGIMFVIGYRQ